MVRKLFPAALLALTVAACGPTQVVLTAETEVEDPEQGTVNRPLANLEVRFYPFDRDLVFDSLTQAAERPEPAIPQDLLDAQAEVASAQDEWKAAETEWQTLRDDLTRINQELQGLNRGETRYVQLYNEFQEADRRVGGAQRAMEAAFSRFDELQKATIRRADSVRLVREQWADEAFAEAGAVFLAKSTAAGREMVTDTTDANGSLTTELKKGQWWASARESLPFEELYWNMPFTIEGGDPVTVTLTPANAQRRPNM
ncbi:MAG: hypothetical protein R3E10_11035 [Gemmatimonadota bacterium]